MSRKVGFIGAGYMGYGIAKNLIKKKFDLKVIAYKKRHNINKLVKNGAEEVKNYNDLCKDVDCILICVTNTPIAIKIAKKISTKLKSNSLVIDITTHNINGPIKMNKIFKVNKINYVESPVMGGPVQAEKGILGSILGGSKKNIKLSTKYLNAFCKKYYHFGPIGMGAKAKLINNFLSLGTATFVIETIKSAKKMNIDFKKFYNVAKLGSGNSGALNRIAENLLKSDYKGYIFSVDNTLKDLTYIHNLLKNIPNARKLSKLTKSYYKDAQDKGYGDLLISELIKK